MKIIILIASMLIAASLSIYGCTSCGCGSCTQPAPSDVSNDTETPPQTNTVDSCDQGQTIECAGGGVRKCDCTGDYCLWAPCET